MSAAIVVPGIRLRRVGWRPRFSGMAAFTGLLAGAGGLLRQQQAGQVYPTPAIALTALLGGAAVSLLMVNLGGIVGVVRANRRIAKSEVTLGRRLTVAPVRSHAVPASPGAVAGWNPSHAVPAGGLDAWDAPDPEAAPVASLDPGLEVRVLARDGAWAHVLCSNGWSTWTDGRALEPVRA